MGDHDAIEQQQYEQGKGYKPALYFASAVAGPSFNAIIPIIQFSCLEFFMGLSSKIIDPVRRGTACQIILEQDIEPVFCNWPVKPVLVGNAEEFVLGDLQYC